ncbi:MAG: hypothetical protein Q7K29_04550, partial [Thermoleophilia bacterium]|nr:hypothetical protein [Thermoleophilia bacterium]
MSRNLVAKVGNGTSGGTSPLYTGAGGLGSTYIYDYDQMNTGNSVTISDNGSRGTVYGTPTVNLDVDGNLVFVVSFRVKNWLNVE